MIERTPPSHPCSSVFIRGSNFFFFGTQPNRRRPAPVGSVSPDAGNSVAPKCRSA